MKIGVTNSLAAALYVFLVGLAFCITDSRADNTAPIPRASSLIVDQAKLLTADQRAALETRLEKIQASGRAQIGILIAATTGDETLTQYSLRAAEAWQLGSKDRDNGLLILIVPAKNAARIEVGYGLEGSIPDARASIYVNDFLPSLQASGAAGGLSILLDKIEDALPQGDQKPQARNVLDEHPEWKLPFVLVVFSPFAIFPLIAAISMSSFPGMRSSAKSLTLPPFAVCCAALVSAALLATMYGFAAWSLWGSNKAGYVAAVLAFALPLLWSLNTCTHERLGPVARCGLIIGNLCVVLMFFAIITLFVGMGLSVAQLKEVWAAPLFAALLAVGLAVFLFPGRPATVLMLFLRSYGHFIIALVVAYSALQPIHAQPAPLAFGAAALFTALAAIGLYLDSRETKASPVGERVATRRWSVWFFVAAILVFVPFVVVTLIHAVLGDDFYTRIVQLSAGGGSIAAVIWWLARQGFFSLVIGLGGKFGGGGAGRDG